VCSSLSLSFLQVSTSTRSTHPSTNITSSRSVSSSLAFHLYRNRISAFFSAI
jgi:hypothetical protein